MGILDKQYATLTAAVHTFDLAAEAAIAAASQNSVSQFAPTNWLGTNDSGNSYWDVCRWTDATRCASGWYSTDDKLPLKWTADGYPVGPSNAPNSIASRSQNYMVDCPAGTYNVTWQGNATLVLRPFNGTWTQTGPNSGTLVQKQLGKNNGDQPNALLWIDCTMSDPANPLSNLKVWLPGYGPGTNKPTQVYRDEHIAMMKTYASVRCMSSLQVSGSVEINWADRVTPTSYDWGTRGLPIEAICQLVKETGMQRVWVNVPIGATNDYITQAAKLYHSLLPSSVEVMIELCNENWNWGGGFLGWGYINSLANGVADPNFPNIKSTPWVWDGNIVNGKFVASPQGGPYVTDEYSRAARCAADRAKNVASIFLSVFSDRPGKCTPVLAGQAANPAWLTIGLQFLTARDGKHPFTYIAIAPYFDYWFNNGHYLTATGPNGAPTADDVFAACKAFMFDASQQWDGLRYQLSAHRSLAKQYNCRLVCYEGGQSFWPGVDKYDGTELGTKCQLDPRMGEAYDDYYAILHNHGVEIYHDFCAFGTWSKWGYWGCVQSYEDMGLTNHRWAANVRESLRSNQSSA